ncbi:MULTISPECIES: hypothetical protein [Streptomyces]|uniref:hypothetical protein n=1 Tax=Streptomyces TaxID=1883 RepID=UPI000759B7B5|nr:MULTISPECIES: hypothetical protein [Streptomyces]
MRTAIGYTVESIGYVVGVQGLLGFASRTFFGTEWGWLHKVVDLPPAAHLGIAAVGLALVVVGVRTRKAAGLGEAA